MLYNMTELNFLNIAGKIRRKEVIETKVYVNILEDDVDECENIKENSSERKKNLHQNTQPCIPQAQKLGKLNKKRTILT